MTFALGQKSIATLNGVHPDLVRVVKHAIDITEQDFTVFEGLRTIERQREYVRRGVSKTMNSKHLIQADGLGHAVDLVPWIDGAPRWEALPCYEIAAAMREAAKAEGVRLTFGGIWDRVINDIPLHAGLTAPASIKAEVNAYGVRHPGPDLVDLPHYQLA